jgi:protein-arginine kinase activator protein McsA
VFEKHDALQHFDDDGFVVKLREMREAIVAHYALGPSLAEQLDAAISKEEYELAAELRDQLEEKMGREKKSRESYRK